MIIIYTPKDLKEEAQSKDSRMFNPFTDLEKPVLNAELLAYSNGFDNEVFILNNSGLNYKFEKEQFESIVSLAKMEAEAEPLPKPEAPPANNVDSEKVEVPSKMEIGQTVEFGPSDSAEEVNPPEKKKSTRKKKSS